MESVRSSEARGFGGDRGIERGTTMKRGEGLEAVEARRTSWRSNEQIDLRRYEKLKDEENLESEPHSYSEETERISIATPVIAITQLP